MNQPLELKINQIRTDGGTQPRAQLNYNIVNEYAEFIEDGANFPPVEVIYDGSDYWLWDGFHRVESHKKAGCTAIRANVKQGTRRDAVLSSVGANNSHGLRRTNDDKRRAVMTLLNDAEWVKWSDREIARQCNISNTFVGKVRQELHPSTLTDQTSISKTDDARNFYRNGKTYEMGIGKPVTPPVGVIQLQPRPAPYMPTRHDIVTSPLNNAEHEDIGGNPEDAPTLAKVEPKKPQHFTLTAAQWQQADAAQRAEWLFTQHQTSTTFNQTNDNIEWASWSWNPVTGCLHNCAYCYARDIANRFYTHLPDGERFAPVFYPDRLSAPDKTKQPDLDHIADHIERMAKRNVFVCSMADLFGKWVPKEWIDEVLQQAWDNPQWTFLFLTKFPIRMAEFEYPPNTWIGTTVDTQYAVERAEKAFRKVREGGYEGVAWLSCEPMMERLTFSEIDLFDWVVVGGSSKSTQTPEFKPPFEWIVHLWNQAKTHNLPIYMKTNLGIEQRVKEYPTQSV